MASSSDATADDAEEVKVPVAQVLHAGPTVQDMLHAVREMVSKKIEATKDEDCGICFCPITERGRLDCCAHRFCVLCILRWSEVGVGRKA